jgi:hypothetical protein
VNKKPANKKMLDGRMHQAWLCSLAAVCVLSGCAQVSHTPASYKPSAQRADTESAIPQPTRGQSPLRPLPSGVIGNTLCLNADLEPADGVTGHIERFFGKGAVESPSDAVYVPPRPHVLANRDNASAASFFSIIAIEPTDVNQDLVPISMGGDRSRTELKIAPSRGGMHERFQAREGDTFSYGWRFRIPAAMKFAPSFTHIHQIKAFGGRYSDPPLITFTAVDDGKSRRLEIRHIANQMTNSSESVRLAEIPLDMAVGRWIDVHQEVVFSNSNGRYKVRLQDESGNVLLAVDRAGLALWRTGADHMRPKWGIYRKHHEKLNQHVADAIDFANFAISIGSSPASTCR